MTASDRRQGRVAPAWLLAFALGSAGAQGLPAGEGREAVAAVCGACHSAQLIVESSGYTAAGWRALMATMVDYDDIPNEHGRIVDYLATHFPPNDRRAPTLVAGDTRVVFEEWVTPTLGQRTRDPAEAPDGSIWWAGQWANLVGRLDPATGAMREYPLPTGAMPHTVLVDDAGNAWYTGNKNGTVGRLEPDTGELTVFLMPERTHDPHSAVFDEAGILWFTLQHSNMIGRLDPATDDIRLVALPTPDARPYGIRLDADGAPWVACNGSNCLVKVDPQTVTLTEVRLPDPATRVRRLDIAADGSIWYVNSSLGRLGRYDPATGDVREWPSPSGPGSHPYAIAVLDGAVWYNESGMRPDTLVRFDPATESFQSWPIPSGDLYAGVVRHMRVTRDGDLLIHQSATNRVIRVRVQSPASD